MAMCLGKRRNMGDLQLLLKQSYRVCSREEDAESILDPPLHLPPDEGCHIRGACQGVGTLGDGSLT